MSATDDTAPTATLSPPLSADQFDRLRAYGTAQDVAVGDVLFSSGDAAYDFLLVESGSVAVVRTARHTSPPFTAGGFARPSSSPTAPAASSAS